MKEIPLTQGKVALVDDEDYEWLNQWNWFSAKGYACRNSKWVNGKRTQIYMHREIIKTPDGMYTDHINWNKSDNRKSNLRVCTQAQNTYNRKRYNKNGYRGVYWQPSMKKWGATICINGEPKYLGYHSDIKDAAIAYNNAAMEYFGDFAILNVT